jgi:heptosyltransferase-2
LVDAEQAALVDNEAIRPRLYPGTDDVAAVDELVGERARAIIAMAPGSVWATKRWPYYAELGRLLVDRFDVVVVGAQGDGDILGDLLSDQRVIDATGKLSLLGSAELIGRSDAIVTNDSSPQHLASAMGTRTVTVFGPTVPQFGFGPLAPGSEVMGHLGLACRPCDRHGPQRCPLGHWRCMREVAAREVFELVMNVIQRDATR